MIINQAVADLFVGLVSVPMFTLYRLNEDSLFAKVFLILDTFFGKASLIGLAVLAIERAHATYFPFRHSTLGKGPFIIGIVLMWTAPLIAVGPIVFSNVMERKTRSAIKTVFIIFALVVISGAYSLIVLKVRCSATRALDVTIQENKKLTVTLGVVTILSLLMWLPYQCLLLVSKPRNHSFLYYSAKFLHYGNSLVNPVVYAFRMREIKREILRVQFLCRCNNQISTNNESELG
ncbi:adenosine receptor A2a [Exaiptasia diaphana]|uniref:G-protein coupled receptors family 1 profile domain-containing protein n=1 Tax=Exaiptasia diaphana TaxID=2652724 RepID=A0A913Y396_EXADI|nr:adenosine receptor A2a [Exaiptasia diaphana]